MRNLSANTSSLLDDAVDRYNRTGFIENDPISIPHRYSRKEDIEVSGFLTAIISWGNRQTIIQNGLRLCHLMNDDPYAFIMDHRPADLHPFLEFKHRTFQPDDLLYFISALKRLYTDHGGLEGAFNTGGSLLESLANFHDLFFEGEHLKRSRKHIANIRKGSTAKRLNMFLRWMVRADDRGVDFGLWRSISPAELFLPLDVHSGRVARSLGLLHRKQNDWKAVEEVTTALCRLDPNDPIKYDYALFGLGVNGEF